MSKFDNLSICRVSFIYECCILNLFFDSCQPSCVSCLKNLVFRGSWMQGFLLTRWECESCNLLDNEWWWRQLCFVWGWMLIWLAGWCWDESYLLVRWHHHCQSWHHSVTGVSSATGAGHRHNRLSSSSSWSGHQSKDTALIYINYQKKRDLFWNHFPKKNLIIFRSFWRKIYTFLPGNIIIFEL